MHAALFFGGRQAAVPGQETEVPVVEMSAVLATAEDRVVEEAAATLERRHQAHHHAVSPEERRRDVRDLFELVVQCVHEGRTEPIIASSQQIAANRFEAGFDIAEIQGTFNAVDEILGTHKVEMERLAVLRAGLLLAWDYGPVRCSPAYVFHDHANR